jgi:capsular polysaccharide export protein
MEGLTFQSSLDDFWTQASPPDEVLFNNFQQAVIEQTQINGGFYNKKGIEMAVEGSLSYFSDQLS